MEEQVAAPPPPPGVSGTELPPLENPAVLKRLFELIPFELEDFKRIRLVSRAWHKVSLSTWRNNAWLSLEDSDEDEMGGSENVEYEEAERLPMISRQRYLDLLDNKQLELFETPFRKYSLENWKIKLQSVNQDGEQDQVRFWNRVGPLMTHLELSASNFAGVADFRTVFFEATPKLQSLKLKENTYNDKRSANKEQRLDPKLSQHAVILAKQVQNNLVELEIEQPLDAADDFGPLMLESLPITWMELIIHFPNIQKLKPLLLAVAVEAELLELFESVEILRKKRGPGYLAHLTDLDLTFYGNYDAYPDFCGTLFSSIIGLHFPLKRLAFKIDSTVDDETFKQLLQHPLEYLRVVRQDDEDAMPFQNFPFGLKFIALKELTMWGPVAPNLVFLRECPNLEKFSNIFREGDDADLTLGLNDGNPAKLEKLKYFCIDNFLCGAEQIGKLGGLMPNVASLEIGLDAGGFRAVCEIWKELEHLKIDPWRIGEEAFLGKDERGVKFHHPNITDLKQLKELNMEFQGPQQGLTDAMILDGILALPNLLNVDQIYISSQVSPYTRSQLELKFPRRNIFTPEEEEEPPGGNEFAVAAAEFQQNLQNNSAADSR